MRLRRRTWKLSGHPESSLGAIGGWQSAIGRGVPMPMAVEGARPTASASAGTIQSFQSGVLCLPMGAEGGVRHP